MGRTGQSCDSSSLRLSPKPALLRASGARILLSEAICASRTPVSFGNEPQRSHQILSR